MLGASDIVITATGAAAPILTKAHIEAVMRPRRNRPLFIIDIADAARRRAGGRRDRAGVPLQHRRSAGDRAREPGAARQRGRARRGDRRRGGRASSAPGSARAARFRPSSRCGSGSRTIRRAELERLDFKLSALPPEARPERARVDEITRLHRREAAADADRAAQGARRPRHGRRLLRGADAPVRPHRVGATPTQDGEPRRARATAGSSRSVAQRRRRRRGSGR